MVKDKYPVANSYLTAYLLGYHHGLRRSAKPTNCDELPGYALNEDLQEEAKWPKENPAKHGKWIKGKYWDEWFCPVCHNAANLDWKENPILSDYCPNCGAQMTAKKQVEKLKGVSEP